MKSRKHALAALLLALGTLAIVLVGASAGSAKSQAAYKAAWIYVGPHNDGGWSQAHDQGRLYVQKARGAQATHPGVKVKLIWTNSWFSPDKEKKAAESLHAAGADVIGQNVDSPAAGQFAQSAGIPWVGYDSNAKKFAPTSWLTAAVYNWGGYYTKRVRAAMNGTWKTGFYYGSIKDGFTDIAPYGPKVSAATKAKIAAKRKALVNGTFYEFAGPLYDQSGKLRVPKGKKLTVKDLYAMDWLVKGVIGSAKG